APARPADGAGSSGGTAPPPPRRWPRTTAPTGQGASCEQPPALEHAQNELVEGSLRVHLLVSDRVLHPVSAEVARGSTERGLVPLEHGVCHGQVRVGVSFGINETQLAADRWIALPR